MIRMTGHVARLEILEMPTKFLVEKSETAEFSMRP
jgi:hypothetical protein